MIFGAIPPPRNFAKIRTRGGRGLLAEQPKDSIPPWGTAERGGAGRRLCRSRAGAAERRRCASAGRTRAGFRRGGARRTLCRAERRAFSARKPGPFRQAAGRQRGTGGAWLRGAHKGRVSGATARGGRVAGRRGAGGIRRLSGVDAGKARAGAAVYGGRGRV